MNDCKQNCDLHMGCTTPKISAVGNYSAPLIIVLDSPTRKDDEGGSLCSGKMGEYLFKLLGEYRSNIYITSIVKCCPYQNITDPAEGVRIPYIEEINQCLPNFYEELSHFDPNKTVIMLMGDAPMEAILGKKTLEKKDVGDLQYAEIDGVNWKVMPNYSPAFILRGNLGSSIESTFKSTLEVAINLYRQETEEEKVYTIATPSEAVKETKLIIEAYQDKDIKHVLFDCETTGLVPWRDKVFMYSFYAEGVTKKSVAAPLLVSNVIHHEKYPYPVYPVDFEVSPRDRIMVSNAIGDMIRAVPITGHNLKYDISMIVLAERIVKLEEVKLYYDTLLMSHILIGRDQFGALDLKTLCSELFGVPSWDAPIDSYLSMFRLTEDRTYDKIPTSIVGKYAAEDTYYNSKLFDLLESRITDENRNIINIIHGIQPVFTEAEIKGICFDTDIFGYIRDSYKDILSGHRKELMGLCDPWVQPRLTEALEVNARKRKPKSQEEVEKAVFNMSSPKQKADILYGYFGMPLIETRKKGKKSSTGGGDKETIAKLLKHPDVSEEGRQFLGTLTKYTALNKLITSYIDNAESMISDGNIYHPSYNINGAVTGRHCLLGDTLIPCLDGKNYRIDSISKGTEVYIYGCTGEGSVVPTRGISLGETKQVDTLAEVTLDNGEKIRCTVDHRFMLRDGSYAEAQDLVAGQSLMPLYYPLSVASVDIINLESPVLVYDLEVPETSNFALSAGIFVHNSSGYHTLPKKCFTGDTKISLLNGSEVKIEDLVGVDHFWLYSRDSEGMIVPGLGHSARVTKHVTELCVVTLDNGEEIKCTPDHWFMLRSGEYKEAKDLTKEDSLMPLYRYQTTALGTVDKRGVKNKYYSVSQHNRAKLKPLHRLVYEYFDTGEFEVVHHINGDPLNNDPENLAGVSKSFHSSHHLSKKWEDLENNQYLLNVRNWTESRRLDQSTRSKEMWRHADDAKKRRMAWGDEARVNGLEARRQLYKNNPEFKNQVYAKIRETRSKTDWSLNLSNRLQTSWENEEYASKMKYYQSISPIVSTIKSFLEVYSELTEENYNKYRKELQIEGRRNTPLWKNLFIKTGTSTVEELIDFCNNYNHKITKVELIKVEPTPVYDITVEEHHNFALTAGVFVHNSDIKRLYTTRWKNQGGLIACFDYSQLELRVIASLANESAWIEAFEQGVDVHQATAAKAFNVPVEKVTSDQRKAAKSVNFGLVYGISDAGLAENIGVSIDEAARLKKAVFAGCTGLNDWFAERHSYVDAHKSITTVFGRTIPIDMQTLWKQEDKEANHRRAVNYSVQSPGSDLVTDSIVRIYRNMKKRGMKTILIGSVHDSILFDIYPGELPMVVKLVKHACEVENMRMYPWIKCPIVVDATIGLSWGGGIDFKVSYEDGGMCFKGEGLRKDILSIIRSGEGVYDWTYEVLKVEEVKEQPKDKVIRDRYTWEAVLKLGI